ncbi:hypothetical protein [Mannheimia sp. ZY171111]|uniref:hypothetical protein n=1 Tax=Mannheimia sp. ZY171111 TaxID=2679995 RepID=UPI001ADDD40F|nr:hypothetical protein [Mannheimia sp. ZY171111]QTM00140.1 hypothetical protein GM698_00180 [Mannheimia sp. ZY171111]
MSHPQNQNSTQAPANILFVLTIILLLALIAYNCFLLKNINSDVNVLNIIYIDIDTFNNGNIKSYITLYIPPIFLSLSILFSALFLSIRQFFGKNCILLYYLFLISITALSLSFIEIHKETEEMVKNLQNISNDKLILIKSITILIPAISFIANYFAATLINLFKNNAQNH